MGSEGIGPGPQRVNAREKSDRPTDRVKNRVSEAGLGPNITYGPLVDRWRIIRQSYVRLDPCGEASLFNVSTGFMISRI